MRSGRAGHGSILKEESTDTFDRGREGAGQQLGAGLPQVTNNGNGERFLSALHAPGID